MARFAKGQKYLNCQNRKSNYPALDLNKPIDLAGCSRNRAKDSSVRNVVGDGTFRLQTPAVACLPARFAFSLRQSVHRPFAKV